MEELRLAEALRIGGKKMANLKDEIRNDDARDASAVKVDMKLEVVVIPVSDGERAKEFYARLGWRLDADVVSGRDSRLIQFTPPGSGCSIQFGKNLFGKNATAGAPGSAQGLYLIVSDIESARNELVASGVATSEVFHCSEGYACRFPGNEGRVSGVAPERGSYGSFVTFSDPDGNGWLLQEVTKRFPGRVDSGVTSFNSARDLASALRRAAAAHGNYEKRIGAADPNWPDWYAEYLVREQSGEELPQ
jgi:catechol 2,3-dioxygenase-like lactoylglutathione lyase family enzyme